MLWTDTAFGAGGRSRTGLCGLVATHVCMFPLRVVSWSIPSHKKRGGADSDSSGVLSSHFQSSRCQRCLERRPQDYQRWSTRWQRWRLMRQALRLPAAVDSLAALAFNKAWRRPVRWLRRADRWAIHGKSRGWIDDPLSVALPGMRER